MGGVGERGRFRGGGRGEGVMVEAVLGGLTVMGEGGGINGDDMVVVVIGNMN